MQGIRRRGKSLTWSRIGCTPFDAGGSSGTSGPSGVAAALGLTALQPRRHFDILNVRATQTRASRIFANTNASFSNFRKDDGPAGSRALTLAIAVCIFPWLGTKLVGVNRLSAAALVALLGTTSCSVIQVRLTPKSDSPTDPPACRSWGWPVADAVLSLATFGLNGWAASISESTNGYNGCESNRALCRHADRSPGYVIGSVFAASALYGLIVNGVCESRL
jgi:hypothetical protein